MAKSPWRVAGASVTGAYHSLKNEACQDRHVIRVTPGGALIAVVSDGAGSARFGGEGAALLVAQVCEALARALGRGKPRPSRALLRRAVKAVCAGIKAARRAAEGELYDYHATLVGAVMLPGKGGLFFHIGDGAALGVASGEGRWVLSPPRNGEYSYETYFFTEPDWRRNLRFKLVGPEHDTIFVMTDGVTDLGLRKSGSRDEPFMAFFDPIARYLAGAEREAGEAALAGTLDTPAARERSTDDKTLVWAQAAR